jgi:hypothetical protein
VLERRRKRLQPEPARCDQRRDVATDCRRRIDAKDPTRGPVPADDPPSRVDADDGVGRRVDHAVQQRQVVGRRMLERRGCGLATRRAGRFVVAVGAAQAVVRKQRLDGHDQCALDETDRDERDGLGQQFGRRRRAPPQRADHGETDGGRSEPAGQRSQPGGGRDAGERQRCEGLCTPTTRIAHARSADATPTASSTHAPCRKSSRVKVLIFPLHRAGDRHFAAAAPAED